MVESADIAGYAWKDGATTCAHEYTFPAVLRIINAEDLGGVDRRVFDLGCGNGAVMALLHENGYQVVGVDPSVEGVSQAHATYPGLSVHAGSAYDDLAGRYGTFPIVVSLDVVEHCFLPRKYARTLFSLVQEGGIAILSTPYHGYWKNLALALTGAMDRHFTALWDYGHIKFWSVQTLRTLLQEAGFRSVQFRRIGRIPPVAKTMIAIARK